MTFTPSTRRLLDGVEVWVSHRSIQSARPRCHPSREDLLKNDRVRPTHWLICAGRSYSCRLGRRFRVCDAAGLVVRFSADNDFDVMRLLAIARRRHRRDAS